MTENKTEKNYWLDQWRNKKGTSDAKTISIKDKVKSKWADLEAGKSTLSLNGVAIPFSEINPDMLVSASDKVVVRHTAVGG